MLKENEWILAIFRRRLQRYADPKRTGGSFSLFLNRPAMSNKSRFANAGVG